jgi:hypothetical protein
MKKARKCSRVEHRLVSQSTLQYCNELLLVFLCFVIFCSFFILFMYDDDHLLFCLVLCYLPIIILYLLTAVVLAYIYIFTVGWVAYSWCIRQFKKRMSKSDTK